MHHTVGALSFSYMFVHTTTTFVSLFSPVLYFSCALKKNEAAAGGRKVRANHEGLET
jgi:hypothetical protein